MSKIVLWPGVQVQTLGGESDLADDRTTRSVPPGTWGTITEAADDPRVARGRRGLRHWAVEFAHHVRVLLTAEELFDASKYSIKPAETVEHHLLALRYGHDIGLCMMDEEIVEHAQAIAGQPERLLEVIRELRDLKAEKAASAWEGEAL